MISRKAKTELELIREEMDKENPDGEKLFELLCGDKYTEPLIKNHARNSDKKRD